MTEELMGCTERTRQGSRYGIVLLLFAVFVMVLVMTEMTPLVADDYDYAFSWSYFIRIDNLKLLRGSMNTHRLFTHGRVFAQGWVCLFLMVGVPEWAFSLANAAVCTSFFGFCHAFFRRQGLAHPTTAAATAGALLWICMPVFGQVFLWLDGACNYFWGAALCWGVLEQAFRMEEDGRTRYKTARTVLLLPFAFVAGAWSEHISFAALVILLLFLLAVRHREKRFPFQGTAVFGAGAAGYLYLMFQPSMLPGKLKNRAGAVFSGYLKKLGILAPKLLLAAAALAVLCLLVIWSFRCCSRKIGERRTMTVSVGILLAASICGTAGFALRALLMGGPAALVSSAPAGILLTVSVFLYALWEALRQNLDRKKLTMPLILTAGGMSALIPFLAASYKPARGFCAPVVFMILGSVLLLGHSFGKTAPAGPEFRKKRALMALLTACFLLYYVVGFQDIARVYAAERERQQDISAALEGDGILIARPYPCHTKYSAQYDLQDLEPGGSWPNDKMAAFYGLKEIVVELP